MNEQNQTYVKTEEEKYKIAKERVNKIIGFYTHLSVYVVVNLVLFIIWFINDRGGYPWFLWPLGGWGIGIVFNALSVFVFCKMKSGGWEQRKIKEIMSKMD